MFYVIFLVKYVLKIPKYGKICDSESGKRNVFKPFITG